MLSVGVASRVQDEAAVDRILTEVIVQLESMYARHAASHGMAHIKLSIE